MEKLIKPAAILMYLMVLPVFLIIGMFLSSLAGLGDNQGLAGGAIIFGYGALTAVIGLIAAIFFTYETSHKSIVTINWVLLLILLSIGISISLKMKDLERQKEIPVQNSPTTPISQDISNEELFHFASQSIQEKNIGLGFFSPEVYQNKVLYFYGQVNLAKPLDEHLPYDSITFYKTEHGGIDISYAPPWLQPAHLKLDYGILYFNVISFSREFVEVEVNTTTQQTTHVAFMSGQMIFWPQFLLNTYTIEFPEGKVQSIRIKPFDNSSQSNIAFNTMKAIKIRQDWIMVELLNEDLKKTGEGWIKWKDKEQLIIRYSLLC